MNDALLNLLITALASTALSSLVIAFWNRRKTHNEAERIKSESVQIDLQSKALTAEAFDAWLESNVKLQKRREEEKGLYEKELKELKQSYERKLAEVEAKFTERIRKLESRVASLETERTELMLQNFSLLKELQECGGD